MLPVCFVSPWSSFGSCCPASWPLRTRRTVRSSSTMAVACARLVFLVISHLALYFFPSCRQVPMLGIPAGMDQIDSSVVRFWRTWCQWFRLQKTVDFCSCSPPRSSTSPSSFRGCSPWSLWTTETPQLLVDTVVDAPFYASRAGSHLYGVRCSLDQHSLVRQWMIHVRRQSTMLLGTFFLAWYRGRFLRSRFRCGPSWFPSCSWTWWSMPLLRRFAGRQNPRRGAGAVSHGLPDHKHFLLLDTVVDVPVCRSHPCR